MTEQEKQTARETILELMKTIKIVRAENEMLRRALANIGGKDYDHSL